MSRHFMQISHIRRVHACSAVTCHLHIRQNDRSLLRATAHTVNSVKKIKSFQRRTICRLGVKVLLGRWGWEIHRRRENTNVQRKNLKTVAFFDGMKETERMESGLKKKREKKKKMENGRTLDGARQKLDFNVLSFPHRVTLR